MVKQIQAFKWSNAFGEIMSKENITLEEYEYCLNEWKGAHEGRMIRHYIYAIILFCGGLWAVNEQVWFIAVLLLALASNYNRQSSHHILFTEIMELHRLLAKLTHNASQKLTEDQFDEHSMTEINEFAENHPYFDEISDEIAIYIRGGMTLQEAYEKAMHEKLNST